MIHLDDGHGSFARVFLCTSKENVLFLTANVWWFLQYFLAAFYCGYYFFKTNTGQIFTNTNGSPFIFQILLCMKNGLLKSNTRTYLNIISSIRNFAAIYIEYFIYKKSAGRIFFIYVKTRDLMNRQRIWKTD